MGRRHHHHRRVYRDGRVNGDQVCTYTHRGYTCRVQCDAGLRFQSMDLPFLVVEITDGWSKVRDCGAAGEGSGEEGCCRRGAR